jgi:hypothetical protein
MIDDVTWIMCKLCLKGDYAFESVRTRLTLRPHRPDDVQEARALRGGTTAELAAAHARITQESAERCAPPLGDAVLSADALVQHLDRLRVSLTLKLL